MDALCYGESVTSDVYSYPEVGSQTVGTPFDKHFVLPPRGLSRFLIRVQRAVAPVLTLLGGFHCDLKPCRVGSFLFGGECTFSHSYECVCLFVCGGSLTSGQLVKGSF